jgi:hypothetical protein
MTRPDESDDTVPCLAAPAVAVTELPPELYDLVALVAAFTASTALGPLLSFSYEDIRAADLRYANFFPNISSTGNFACSTTSAAAGLCVSQGLATFTSMNASLCVLSLLAAILVRCSAYFEASLAAEEVQLLKKLLIVPKVLAVAPLGLACVLCVVIFYFCGWVVLPPTIAGSTSWFWSGAWLMVSLGLIFVYTLSVLICLRHRSQSRMKRAVASRMKRAAAGHGHFEQSG